MANSTDQVIQVLRKAELELLSIVASAAAEADYEAIDLARSSAEAVRRLINEGNELTSAAGETRSTPNAAKRAARKRTRRSPGSGSGYPRFEFEENSMLRVGWSRKRRSEYRHRVPEDSYRRAVQAISNTKPREDGLVIAGKVLESPILHGDCPVPSYQVYAVISFLKEHDALKSVGREGYALANAFPIMAERLWRSNGRQGGR